MKSIRTIEFKVEKNETLVISRRSGGHVTWCSGCGSMVGMISPEEAASIAKIGPRRIYSDIEAGKIHFIELPEGRLLVCLDSLLGSGQLR